MRVLAYGRLLEVDLHALPWRGRPLVASLPVAYPLDLAATPVAGHGVFAGRGGRDSAQRLAGRRLSVGEILALPWIPARVVLPGCETARTALDAPPAAVSLAHASLTGGAEQAVAAVRPVDDRPATQLMGALYRGGVPSTQPCATPSSG